MSEAVFFKLLVVSWTLLALVVFITLFFFSAPYGKMVKKGFGPSLPNWLGWLLMEAPASLGFLFFFLAGGPERSAAAWVFLGMWQLHYIYRAFIYPFGLRGNEKRMPVSVVGMGVFHNVVNSYLNARYLYTFTPGYAAGWIAGFPFLAGLALFLTGMLINRKSDSILRNLRQPGENTYKIPYGGLFRFVSCPNYLGEIIEWSGWALSTWSLPGLAFAIWTCANLVPRAWAYHRWYLEHFPNYPPERTPLIPRLPQISGGFQEIE
jgi:protein-S-isoprenylcysteine O-methyltransferase Ste14